MRSASCAASTSGRRGASGSVTPVSSSIRLRQLYRRWVGAMYLAVEMQNAHRNDLSIRDRATTRAEEPHAVSPFKAGLLAEIHPRFVANCVRGLEVTLCELWAPTSGACSPTEDVRWMARRLEAHTWRGDGGRARNRRRPRVDRRGQRARRRASTRDEERASGRRAAVRAARARRAPRRRRPPARGNARADRTASSVVRARSGSGCVVAAVRVRQHELGHAAELNRQAADRPTVAASAGGAASTTAAAATAAILASMTKRSSRWVVQRRTHHLNPYRSSQRAPALERDPCALPLACCADEPRPRHRRGRHDRRGRRAPAAARSGLGGAGLRPAPGAHVDARGLRGAHGRPARARRGARGDRRLLARDPPRRDRRRDRELPQAPVHADRGQQRALQRRLPRRAGRGRRALHLRQLLDGVRARRGVPDAGGLHRPLPVPALGLRLLQAHGRDLLPRGARRARPALHDLPPVQRLRAGRDARRRARHRACCAGPDLASRSPASPRCRSSARASRRARSRTSTTSPTGSSRRPGTRTGSTRTSTSPPPTSARSRRSPRCAGRPQATTRRSSSSSTCRASRSTSSAAGRRWRRPSGCSAGRRRSTSATASAPPRSGCANRKE